MDDLGTRTGGHGSDRDPRTVIDELLAEHLASASAAELRRWAADLRDEADELDRLAAERDEHDQE